MTEESGQIYTDMERRGWISRVPARLRPYVFLARLDRPIGIWLLLLPGWWAILLSAGGLFSLNGSDIEILLLFGAGAVIMRAAGCVINDLWDRNLDRQVERTQARPLASGAASVHGAVLFLALLLTVGLGILLRLSPVAILLGVMTLPLIALYPLMKRLTWWPQFFLGIVFNFGALMGWAAVTGLVQLPAVLLYAAGIFWTLGYDTVYAHQDREDDARIGVRSTALRLGGRSRQWVAGFFLVAWLLLLAAFAAGNAGWLSLVLLALPAGHFIRQLRQWDMDDPASCLRIFRANRDLGLLVLLAAAL